MARVVVGLSGGVDSSVAAYLLKQQGHEVIGLFMRNWHDTTGTLEGDCPWYDDQVFAELVAKRLDIPFRFVDLSDEYRRRVVDYMFAEYQAGRTPNPDVLCNREIKFDVFLKEALKMGAEYVATGHYCRKQAVEQGGKTIYKLLAGADKNKDQSYFLCQLTQEQLRYAMFPIGDLLKPEVRRIAEEQKLATAKRKDSQGICFVGKVDLPVFLQQQIAAKQGNVHEILPSWRGYVAEPAVEDLKALATPKRYTVRDGKKVGTHNGAHFYTIGQRKGLGMSFGKHMFVCEKNAADNTVTLCDGEELFRHTLTASRVNWISGECPASPVRAQAKIRYAQRAADATVFPMENGRVRVEFDEAQRAIAPGQSVVFYDGEYLLGGGIIDA